jgi:crotonobetainyl-CoA:carnitine CoA-transferase CaiB-like acyl-CoA transferase
LTKQKRTVHRDRVGADIEGNHMTAAPLPLPLAGITVLDLSRVLAGPYCGLVLADMGADVIKVENPDGGDDSRSFSEPSFKGVSTYFLSINRNKRSVALDLKSPDGKAAFLKLVAGADVVLENFRTGVMERLGLGYDTLKAVRPGLVHCSISGYGRSGPNVEVPGYDPIAQAESGLMSMIGDPAGSPMRVGPSVVDLVTGLYAAQAIAAALRHVAVAGEGRMIEVALHDTALSMLANYAGSYVTTGRNPTRTGNANQVAQPADVYTAADGPFVLACVTEAQYRKLCTDVIDRPDLLADPRFARNPDRLKNVRELAAILGAIFIAKPRDHWISKIRAAGVPSGAVATVAEALSNDLARERDLVREVVHTGIGPYAALRTPAVLHETAPVPARGAPQLGEHTRDILSGMGGLEDADIDRLVTSGVALQAPQGEPK